MTGTIRVPANLQGPTGFGQGGWTACRLAQQMGFPATVAIRAPIPLETDLMVVAPEDPERSTLDPWRLLAPDGTAVLQGRAWDPDCPDTAPVSVAEAEAAGGRFPLTDEQHPVPFCFSCGVQPDSMGVRSGPLGDGRYATPWTVPARADDGNGTADPALVWAALDCTAAVFAGNEGGFRLSVTAQLAVEILEPVAVGDTYALVAWPGNWTNNGTGGWDGRKRGAASMAFDGNGRCVARSTSFWVALD
ncbi:MAG: hypothetical protein AAF531_13560 [Actinomycetota bacterium]